MIRTRPIEERVNLYNQAMGLREEKGWGNIRIAKALGIDDQTVAHWIYDGREPCGGFKVPDLSPSPELSYILGVYYGDGSAYRDGACYLIKLEAKDQDFVQEFGEQLSKIIEGRGEPYHVWRNKRGYYFTKVSNRLLWEFLKKRDFENHKVVIDRFPAEFLRGFFDSDGGAHKGRNKMSIYASNTNKELLIYVRNLLLNLDIFSTILLCHKEGDTRPFRGRIVQSKKDCHQLVISGQRGFSNFYKHIGFSIRRKQSVLQEIIIKITTPRPPRRYVLKVTTNMQREMRELKRRGWGYDTIARRFKLNPNTVRYHLNPLYRESALIRSAKSWRKKHARCTG